MHGCCDQAFISTVPSAPSGLNILFLENDCTAVNITWNPPLQPNGNINCVAQHVHEHIAMEQTYSPTEAMTLKTHSKNI